MDGDTKLHEAVRYGDSNLVETALEDGLDPNSIGLYGWSPMHEAAFNDDLEILKLLLQFKGNPNCQDDLEGCTPLHYAAREGHKDCLRALIKAGGRYDIENNGGKSVLDEASDECKCILDKEKTKDFLNMTLDEARITLSRPTSPQGNSQPLIKSSESPSQRSGSATPDGLDSPRDALGRSTPTAWDTIKIFQSKESSKESGTGTIQLSFEYNSKVNTMKIRVWRVENILLPPAEFSNISRIYVRSHLLPDKKGETKRKTDEIRIDDPTKMTNSLMTLKRKGMRDSFKAVFLPCAFKFSKPLEYQKVTPEMVASKTVHIAVCVRQRYSTKSIPVANIQLPMKTAVRKLLKEKHRLHPCINYSMPDNIHAYDPHDIIVISEGMYSNRTTSHPTLRTKSRQSLDIDTKDTRATSDINLQAVRCHSVESVQSTVIDVENVQKETALDELLEVSVRSSHSPESPVGNLDQSVTVVEVHEMPTPLPGITGEDELTDVSVVSSPRRSLSSPDSAAIDMGVLETIDLGEDSISPDSASTPKKMREGGRGKLGFVKPHITIVDSLEEDFDVKIDKMDDKKRLREQKDEVIHIGMDHGDASKKKGLKGHLFKRKGKHKKEKEGEGGLTNPGYVVDMRTGSRSLLGQFSDESVSRVGQLEMLEMPSDSLEVGTIEEKKVTPGEVTSVLSSNDKKLRKTMTRDQDTTVVNVSKLVSDAQSIAQILGEKEKSEVHSRKKTRRRLPEVGAKLKEEEKKVVWSKDPSTKETASAETPSPVPVIVVECVDETEGSISPGKRSPQSPRSPRQARRIVPLQQPDLGNISDAGKRSALQDFTPPITRGLPHSELSGSHTRVKHDDAVGVVSGSREKPNVKGAEVKYISETQDSVGSPKLKNRTKSPIKPDSRTRSKSPGKRNKNVSDPTNQFEMMTLWNDEEWREQLDKPEFKLRMFQRTGEDPHPSTPLLQKYHGAGSATSTAVSNPAFVPETPPGTTDRNPPSQKVTGAKVKGKSHRGTEGESKVEGKVEIASNPSITKLKQSWL